MSRHATRSVLLLAALSLALTGCSDDSSQGTEPSTSSPSTEATSAGGPQWSLLADQPEGVPLPAGAYGLTPNGISAKLAVVRAPEDSQNIGGWTFIWGVPTEDLTSTPSEPFRAMGFVTADQVFPDPCGAGLPDKATSLTDPGPTVKDLAVALVAQKGATTSTPHPVTVDGYRGLYLDYRISKGIDLKDCGDHAFDVFTTGPGSWYLNDSSRERAAIWILDVDGERLVLGWVAVPGVTGSEMDEMTAMAESARFVAAE